MQLGIQCTCIYRYEYSYETSKKMDYCYTAYRNIIGLALGLKMFAVVQSD